MVGFDKMASTVDNLEMKNEILHLMTQKEKVEAEIQQFFDVLSTNNVGMLEPLVDREGFPRNDIDVYQVRTARHKIICLQNDHKSIMIKIEAGLHKLHAGNADASLTSSQGGDQQMAEPFARVSLVSNGSPADLCGLRANDLLLEFGSVNRNNFKSMQDVAGVVRASVGETVTISLRRENRNSPLSLALKPRKWTGQGLIGCQIDPLPLDVVER